MAKKRVYIGSLGPYLFEESSELPETGDLSGFKRQGIATDGQIIVLAPPTLPEHTARLGDLTNYVQLVEVNSIDDPSSELAGLNSTREGSLLIAFVKAGSGANVYAFYVWDSDVLSADIPETVVGDGGSWILVGDTQPAYTGYLVDSTNTNIAYVSRGRIMSVETEMLVLVTEGGDYIITEDGYRLTVLIPDIFSILTESGDYVITENSNRLVG